VQPSILITAISIAMLFVTTTSAWGMTFYESMGDCKGQKDRKHYTTYFGTGISSYTRAGDNGNGSGCMESFDGGHHLQDYVSGPLDTHKMWFRADSDTRCRWSPSGLIVDPSVSGGTEPGEKSECYSMTRAIGKDIPKEFWFQCGDSDDAGW
jgi:hypothetical protein